MTRAEKRRLERQSGSRAKYQYTLDQIEAMKKQAVLDAKEGMKKELAQNVDAYIQKEWKKREELFEGETENERMEKMMCLLLSVSVNVLCKKFHWKPVDEGSDKRSKLIRFSDAVLEEINGILVDEMKDIRTYADEVYENCGIRYEMQKEESCAVNGEGKEI